MAKRTQNVFELVQPCFRTAGKLYTCDKPSDGACLYSCLRMSVSLAGLLDQLAGAEAGHQLRTPAKAQACPCQALQALHAPWPAD